MKPPGTGHSSRIDVSCEELEALLEGVRPALGEAGYQKLQAAIRTLSYVTELLETREATLERLRHSSTEKTGKVLKQAGIETDEKKDKAPGAPHSPKSAARGHGRNGADAYRGARKVAVPHASLKAGDQCPDCHVPEPGRGERCGHSCGTYGSVHQWHRIHHWRRISGRAVFHRA